MVEEQEEPEVKPAFLSVVKEQWLDAAFEYFEGEKDMLYFYTSSKNAAKANSLGIKYIYFKPTLPGSTRSEIIAKAEFVELRTDNPREFRLEGSEDEEGKYYYGFKNLRWLDNPLELEELLHFTTQEFLLNSTPGCTIIIDPNID